MRAMPSPIRAEITLIGLSKFVGPALMFVGLDRRGVVAILPERALTSLALIVFLRRASGGELHALRDDGFAGVLYQQMDMVAINALRWSDPVIRLVIGIDHPIGEKNARGKLPGRFASKQSELGYCSSGIPSLSG